MIQMIFLGRMACAPLLSLFADKNRSVKSSGWWFQRFFIFHLIYGMSSFPLTNSIIFQRGRAQPPASHCFCISFWRGEKKNTGFFFQLLRRSDSAPECLYLGCLGITGFFTSIFFRPPHGHRVSTFPEMVGLRT